MTPLRRIHFRTLLLFGRLFAIRYNQSRKVELEGRNYYLKPRRWHQPLVIFAGNVYLRIISAKCYLLPYREWTEREKHLYKNLHGQEALLVNGNLYSPALPGSSLTVILTQKENTLGQKHLALQAAVQSLYQLHRITTHADATADNVLLKDELKEAFWIDFETCHLGREAETSRKADDLLTLLCSSARHFDTGVWPTVLPSSLAAYPDPEIREAAVKMLSREQQRPVVYRYIQTRLGVAEMKQVAGLLTQTQQHG